MTFRITGLTAEPFAHLFGLDDAALAAHGAERHVVDAAFGFPDRIGLRDLALGDRALLLNFVHQPADTPYRASHAIFVAENGAERFDAVDDVPQALRARTLSLRGFDDGHMMRDAALVDGRDIEGTIERLFANPRVAYVHAHAATRGCYLARIDRASASLA